jgi:hypothetical protein
MYPETTPIERPSACVATSGRFHDEVVAAVGTVLA